MADTDIRSLVGRRIGVYEIVEEVGKGGMGVVYRAHDRSLDRDVALKVLLPSLCSDPEFEKRFVREARAAARLDHPNIVHVHTAGRFENVLFIAMQFVRGKTLQQLQEARGGRFEPDEALKIVRQAAEALAAAHKVGLVHRDIKPNNIMLSFDSAADGRSAQDKDEMGLPTEASQARSAQGSPAKVGRVKIMDFGLMRSSLKPDKITQTGVFFGTPEYASPEQCETSNVDGRSDIYSLGAVLYEMLTGRVPHVAETPLALFKKISEEDPAEIRDFNPRVPKPVAALVRRMLARKAADRYESCDALIADIDRALAGQPVTVERSTVKRSTVIGLAAAALMLVAGLVWLLGTAGKAPEVDTPKGGRVGVVVFDFKNGTAAADAQWYEIALSDLLIASLGQHGYLQVPTRDQLLWKVQDMSLGDRVRDEHRRRLVSEFGAHAYVVGTYYSTNGRVLVTATCYRIKDNAPVFPTMRIERPEGEMFALVDEVSAAVARGLEGMAGGTASAPGARAEPKPCQELLLARADGGRARGEEKLALEGAELSRPERDKKREEPPATPAPDRKVVPDSARAKYFRHAVDADTMRHFYQCRQQLEKAGCDAEEFQILAVDLDQQLGVVDAAQYQRAIENFQNCVREVADAKRAAGWKVRRDNVTWVCCEGTEQAQPGTCAKCGAALVICVKMPVQEKKK